MSVDNKDNQTVVSLHLRHSKTDQASRGVYLVLGWTRNGLCLVEALIDYIRCRGPHSGPLFHWASGSPVTKARFVAEVRSILGEAGLRLACLRGIVLELELLLWQQQWDWKIRPLYTWGKLYFSISPTSHRMLGRWRSRAYLTYITQSVGINVCVTSNWFILKVCAAEMEE